MWSQPAPFPCEASVNGLMVRGKEISLAYFIESFPFLVQELGEPGLQLIPNDIQHYQSDVSGKLEKGQLKGSSTVWRLVDREPRCFSQK